MSKQTTLDSFFKCRGNIVMENKYKRRSLSLIRIRQPHKSPKKEEMEDEVEVIILSSSSEDIHTPPEKSSYPSTITSPSSSTDSSQTIVYSLSPNMLQTPPRTPTKKSISPNSAEKFYSPSKKRLVTKRSDSKKRLHFVEDSNQEIRTSEVITKPSYQDDKTQFLLSMIYEYLNNSALKHLLEDPSQELLCSCTQITEPGMRIVCRLFWRQPVWYRIEELTLIATDKKKYSISDIHGLLKSLCVNNLIIAKDENSMNFDDYVKLLKKPELQQICKELKLKIQPTKEEAANALRKFSQCSTISHYFTGKVGNNSKRVLDILSATTGQCYRLSDIALTTLYNLYVLMYLGIDYSIIREKRLELILLHDKLNKETYPIDKDMSLDNASVVFQSREEFYRYLQAHMIYEDYIALNNTQEKSEIIRKTFELYKDITKENILRYKSLQPWLRRFTPAYIYVKILESGVQELKKAKIDTQYLLAVEILDSLIGQIAFRQHKKAEWYAEKALILHNHLKCSEQAAKTLLEGFEAKDLSEEAKDAMRPRAKLIANQCNVVLHDELRQSLKYYAEQDHILESSLPATHVYKQPMDNYNQKGKLRFDVRTKDGRSTLTAEEYCVFYYVTQDEFTHGQHWEGRMMTTVFFLLFWDIIYTKPPAISGIFLSHYQRHPLDMYSENFYINRRTLIDDRLIFIEESTEDIIIEMMQNRWEQRPAYEVSEINRSIAWTDLECATRCLGPRPLAAICRRLATNYGYTHSGFPDLTLWNEHTKKIKFVEVKTDADKPSMKQLQWLQYLTEHKIAAGFCYVGANTTRCKARPRAITLL